MNHTHVDKSAPPESASVFSVRQNWHHLTQPMKRHLSAALAFLCVMILALTPALGADTPPEKTTKPADKPKPEAKVSVTKHTNHVGTATIAYTASAGTMLMKNDKSDPIALFGFTAYVNDSGDPAERPIVFAYNGGPGSSSVWLHMGVLGPKRADLIDLESNTRGPFRTVEPGT